MKEKEAPRGGGGGGGGVCLFWLGRIDLDSTIKTMSLFDFLVFDLFSYKYE